MIHISLLTSVSCLIFVCYDQIRPSRFVHNVQVVNASLSACLMETSQARKSAMADWPSPCLNLSGSSAEAKEASFLR